MCDDLSDVCRRTSAWRHDQTRIWRAGKICDGVFDVGGIANINRAHIDAKRRCCGPDGAELSYASRIGGIPNDRRPPNVGRNLFKQLYPFTAQTVFKNHKACRAATRSVEPCDETRADWIGNRDEHNRQGAAGTLQRRHAERASGEDDIRREGDDDWILAMTAAGLGFAFMPQYSITEQSDVVVRPLIEPEFWREVNLVTVRGRPHSPAIGALVREVMRTQWTGESAPPVHKRDTSRGTRQALS